WASATAGTLALVHGLRWHGTSYFAFGPYLAGAALGLLALRELVRLADRALLERLREAGEAEEPRELDPREAAADLHAAVKPRERLGRSGGVLAAALTAGFAAFFFGLAGWWDGLTMHWAATLLMEALGLGALAVTVRRDHAKAFGPLLLVLELGAWANFAGALLVGMHHYADGLLFSPPMLVLAGAVLFALGMAAEALAGAVLAPERHAASPRPFLESRHLAALGLAGLGVLWALGRSHAFADPAIHGTWRAVLCAGFLAAYAGMAEWSAADLARRAGRMAAGLASHLLLIPGGYLCLLKAHSTGSSWGALWFLALAPLQLLAAGLLDREKHTAQAYLARGGALLVSLGAIALAFFGNAERLAEVPCATFGALLLIALAARRFAAGLERRAYGHAALLALTGTVFFAVRVAAHDPAFGLAETSVWEWPALGALGLLLILAGGATAWETDANGRSLAGQYGALLAFAAAGAAAYQLAAHGMAADYLHVSNVARFEALIVSLLLASGASLAAKRWLNFFAGAYLAPVLALAGYALYVWTLHPGAWEWYSLPAAALLFVWARSRADEDEARANPAAQQEVSVLLGLGCAAALAPSFAQTLAYTPEALAHYYALVLVGLTLVGGAMFARRKIPLLSGSAAVLLGTLVKTAQWAAHREVIYPVLGIGIGFAVLAVGCLFESRMNRAIRQTVDRVRAEARMFWVSWE
ncbi:MAG: hypothetical protein KIS92_21245, partial [Planctomycetota bacterium]|nr:hypothetical protein [Planctomycetota bacterium]